MKLQNAIIQSNAALEFNAPRLAEAKPTLKELEPSAAVEQSMDPSKLASTVGIRFMGPLEHLTGS